MPYRPSTTNTTTSIQKVTMNPERNHRNENKKPGTIVKDRKQEPIHTTPIRNKKLTDERVRSSSQLDRNNRSVITESRDQRNSSRSVFDSMVVSKPPATTNRQPDVIPVDRVLMNRNESTSYTGVVDKFTEPVIKEKVHNPSMEHIGQVHHATVDKFYDPVLKAKVRTPTTNHIGQKHTATIDKFSEPVLKEKVKTPAFEHIGVKHNAVTNKFMEPVLNDKVKTPAKEHVGQKHHATIDKLYQPQLTGSTKTGSVNRNDWGKQAPKGDFKWIYENGAWKKDYDFEMLDGSIYGHI